MSSVSSFPTKSLLDLLDEHPVKRRCVILCIDLKLGLAFLAFLCQTDGPHSAKVIAAVYLFDFLYLCMSLVLDVKNTAAFRHTSVFEYFYIRRPTTLG